MDVWKAPLKKILMVSMLTLITRFVIVVLYVIELMQACYKSYPLELIERSWHTAKWPIHADLYEKIIDIVQKKYGCRIKFTLLPIVMEKTRKVRRYLKSNTLSRMEF